MPVLSQNLIAYYPLDSNANDEWQSNNGTATGVTYAASSGRDVAVFDKSSGEKIDFSAIAGLSFGENDFSISLWVNFDGINSSGLPSIVVAKGFSSQTSPQYSGFIVDAYAGNIQFKVGGNNSFSMLQHGISTGQWYHVACTRSGANTKMYIDGALVQSNTDSTTRNVSNSLPFTMGSLKNVTTWYTALLDGMIDDAAIWGRELSASEVSTIYTEGVAGNSLRDLIGPSTLRAQFASVVHTVAPENARLHGQFSSIVHTVNAEDATLHGMWMSVVHDDVEAGGGGGGILPPIQGQAEQGNAVQGILNPQIQGSQ